jgi:ABC-type transport system involved in cytochrome c biogenesis permease subunit
LSRKMNQFQRLIRTSGQGPNTAIRSIPPKDENGEWEGLNTIDMQVVATMSLEQLAPRRMQFEKELQANIEQRFGPKDKWPPFALANFGEMVEVGLRRELMQDARVARQTISPAAADLTNIFSTARIGKGEELKNLVADYRQKYLGTVPSSDLRKTSLEANLLGQLAPFYHCAFLYLPQIILATLAWIVWSQPLNRSAYWLGIFTFVVHTVCLLLRMYVQGRPPVTNLYASAVFIGWGAVGLGLLLERQYKNGVGNVVAGMSGALSLEIAHFLGGSGDTMAMLQAVLDTNFWLATHVTTVTLGYTATFVAGQIATIYLIRAVFTPSMDRENEKTLGSMMYGVLCFATLLSFVGTVLGGIWADYSWGRFWGWDPKENGAVMIVIWNALILHARWGGMVKVRGMAVLAIVGNMVTAWSWFGTNQLQIGLHSYGFDNRLAQGCMYFWLSQLAMIGIGLIPRAMWRSEWPKPTTTTSTTTTTVTPANTTPIAVTSAKPLPTVTGPVGKRVKTKR